MVTRCGGCSSADLAKVLELASTPPTCALLPVGTVERWETHYPLELLRCEVCTLVQLSCIVDPSIVFEEHTYPYSSGNSGAVRESFRDLAERFPVEPTDVIVDIGANDGSLLRQFSAFRVAVEPTEQIEKARDACEDCVRAPFTASLARQLVDAYGHARLVTACNVLAHVPSIHDTLEGIRILLGDDGTLVADNHDLMSVVAGGQWDTVYHEHLRYYTPFSFAQLARHHGLYPRLTTPLATHGGSFRMVLDRRPATMPATRRLDFALLRRRVWRTRLELRRLIGQIREQGWRIGALGATARATTIINHCGLDAEDIVAIGEVDGSDKIDHYLPGTRIPIIREQDLLEQEPEYLLNLLWYMPDVAQRVAEKGWQGRVITPLPDMKVGKVLSGAAVSVG